MTSGTDDGRFVLGTSSMMCFAADVSNPTVDQESVNVSAPDFSERMIALEMSVAHLEHELEQMSTVLLAVQADLKASREQLSKLERRMILSSEPDEGRDPNDERPPHY